MSTFSFYTNSFLLLFKDYDDINKWLFFVSVNLLVFVTSTIFIIDCCCDEVLLKYELLTIFRWVFYCDVLELYTESWIIDYTWFSLFNFIPLRIFVYKNCAIPFVGLYFCYFVINIVLMGEDYLDLINDGKSFLLCYGDDDMLIILCNC